MRCVGEYLGATQTIEGEVIISFAVDDDFTDFDKLLGEKVVLEVKKLRGIRSDEANRLLWKLCTLIGEALGDVSKDTIYEMKIKEYGVWEDYTIPADSIDVFKTAFRFTEPQYYFHSQIVTIDGEIKPITMACVRCYKGSHLYDTKQMSTLISGVMADAKELGCEVMSPLEIEQALKCWEAQK